MSLSAEKVFTLSDNLANKFQNIIDFLYNYMYFM